MHDPLSLERPGIDPFERLADLWPQSAFSTGPCIVDGGANKGRTVDVFLRMYPAAAIQAFEPIPELARKLARRFQGDERVTVCQTALGAAPQVLTLNILESRTCSSLLAPTGIREKHAGKPMEVTRRLQVAVVRLDDALPTGVDILKLDLQGFELEALRGAEALLPNVKAVLCEVAFKDLYAGQPLAGEVMAWMNTHGFRAEGLYRLARDPLGHLVSGDALFLR